MAAGPPAGLNRRHVIAAACAAAFPRRALAQPLVTLRVAHVPVADAVPYEYAVQQGWFRQAGLDIDGALLSGGSAAATAVIGGAVDVGSSNLFTAVQARAKRIPIVVIAPGGRYQEDVPTSQLLVAADSALRTGRDLEGRTVAVAGLNDMSSLSIRAWVTETGGDPAKVRFVETPMSTMLPMVQDRHVDAMFVSEPALQVALASGATRRLAVTYTMIAKHFFTSVWVAMAPWAEQHRDTALRFAQVIHRATLYTNGHWQDVLPLIAAYTKLPLDVLRGMHQIKGGPSLVAEDIQPMIDAAAKYRVIPSAFAAKEMMLGGAP